MVALVAETKPSTRFAVRWRSTPPVSVEIREHPGLRSAAEGRRNEPSPSRHGPYDDYRLRPGLARRPEAWTDAAVPALRFDLR